MMNKKWVEVWAKNKALELKPKTVVGKPERRRHTRTRSAYKIRRRGELRLDTVGPEKVGQPLGAGRDCSGNQGYPIQGSVTYLVKKWRQRWMCHSKGGRLEEHGRLT